MPLSFFTGPGPRLMGDRAKWGQFQCACACGASARGLGLSVISIADAPFECRSGTPGGHTDIPWAWARAWCDRMAYTARVCGRVSHPGAPLFGAIGNLTAHDIVQYTAGDDCDTII